MTILIKNLLIMTLLIIDFNYILLINAQSYKNDTTTILIKTLHLMTLLITLNKQLAI
jgi:hypothetical protein